MSIRSLAALPLLLLRRLKGREPGLRVLLFHDVPAAQVSAFTALVDGLARQGRLVAPAQAEAILEGRETAKSGACLLSFDDGFVGNYALTREVLDPRGISALFFICPGLMSLPVARQPEAIARHVFDGKRQADGARLMDWDQVIEMKARGHAFGSHTMTHRRLAGLGVAELVDEVGGAALALSERLGEKAPWFAYPFGDIDSIDAAALNEIGRRHRFCRSGVRGANGPGTHPMAIRADQVELSESSAWHWLTVEGGLDQRYAEARTRLDAMIR